MENVENASSPKLRFRSWWELRFDQKIEDCRLRLADLKHELSPAQAPEHVLELRLMAASLLRFEGRVDEAGAEIDAIARETRERGLRPSFPLSFQTALQFLARGDYTDALEQFLLARSAAETAPERVWALTNCLLCLESLGLPYERTRAELAHELLAVPPHESVLHQIQAFDLRQRFREGNAAAVLNAPLETGSRMNQAFYYRLWVSALPFVRPSGSAGGEDEREQFLSSDPRFFQRSYRLRTLHGMVHPDDRDEIKPTELADRFYLWVWLFLADPAGFPFERIEALLAQLASPRLSGRLTSEDYQQLRNALLWLALFEGRSSASLDGFLGRLRPGKSPDFALFDFERAMIGYFEALRDGLRAEATQRLSYLKRSPIWRARALGWSALINAVTTGRFQGAAGLEGLARNVRALLREETGTGAGLLLDLSSGEIRLPKFKSRKDAQISLPICRAFDLLKRSGTVSCERFAQHCFGLHRFDPTVHETKVFNLLARLRALAPSELKIGVKSGQVQALGSPQAWARIGLVTPHPIASALRGSEPWRELRQDQRAGRDKASRVAEARVIRPGLLLRQMAGKDTLTRTELEKITGKSRATNNRIIARWLKQGVLLREGRARATCYRVLNPKLGATRPYSAEA